MPGDEIVINFVIGIFVSLGASFLDALGLNLLKLDHVKEAQKSASEQRSDCGRPLWHIGLYTYIASQLIGSTIALSKFFFYHQYFIFIFIFILIILSSLDYLKTQILVGTKITRKDVSGTCVVVASVIWIVVFGGMYNGDDPEDTISLENLKLLFTRPIFIIYFSALNIITFSGLIFAIWSRWILADDNRKRNSQLFFNMKPKRMYRIVGLMFSLEGGMLASETLLLAKSGVKLFTLSVNSQVNQFTDNTSRFILLALLVTAVLQAVQYVHKIFLLEQKERGTVIVYCLNTALKLYSSVVVVPVFYGTYTALGLVNTIIYLDEIGNYPGWAITLVFVGIGVLIYGVYLLSSKPDPSSRHLEGDGEEQEEIEIIDENHPQEQHQRRREPEETNSQAEEITQVMYHNKSWPSAQDEKHQHARLQNYFAASSPSLTIPPPPIPPPLSPPSADLSLQTTIHPPPSCSSPPIISNNQGLNDSVTSELPPPLSRSEIQQSHYGWWKRLNNIFQRKRRPFPTEQVETGGTGESTEMAMQSMRRRYTNENSNTPSSPPLPRTSDSNLDMGIVPPTIIKVKP
ncbi:hypothetical protein INT45_012008 [Circinella minor]|uniref:Uncharacterized protein n=1 Tax=Circinella minor TaxID=1195481 RepID=A0A8H7SCV2_9FUNG|nr:hypothetical protein INT45_012008 [Circinella minor]